ncbi:MAG: hypothetical protein EAY70_10815 [Sphingomonadales bacterium]|nr:MAG: hypothetical protein EAY70_10815 [Sphingomonadales bacterium]
MQLAALLVLIAAGGWLVAVGVMMALRPLHALHILSLTASSHRVNLSEQVPRLIAGAAMIIRAEGSKLPLLFEIAGWFIAASSFVLLAVPLAWHSGYAKWWAARIPPPAVRTLAPFSLLAGVGLIYAAW